MKSWNAIRKAATAFSKRWKDAYNNRSEVVSAAIGTNLFTHAYDDIGNHLLFVDNAATNTFTHNQVNQMVGIMGTSFSFKP